MIGIQTVGGIPGSLNAEMIRVKDLKKKNLGSPCLRGENSFLIEGQTRVVASMASKIRRPYIRQRPAVQVKSIHSKGDQPNERNAPIET